MNIEFKRLFEIKHNDIITLMNNQLVRRHMPLLTDKFDEHACTAFVNAKEKLWSEYGYGPWAFVIDGQFAGWRGVQPENGVADLALVIHPQYWGIGNVLYKAMIKRAFAELGLNSVTVLLPQTRTRVRGVLRLGFKRNGELKIGNERFIRYQLQNPDKTTA